MRREGLLRHVATRLIGLVPTLLLLITIAFVLIRVAPGGPFDGEVTLPPEVRANLKPSTISTNPSCSSISVTSAMS